MLRDHTERNSKRDTCGNYFQDFKKKSGRGQKISFDQPKVHETRGFSIFYSIVLIFNFFKELQFPSRDSIFTVNGQFPFVLNENSFHPYSNWGEEIISPRVKKCNK